MWRGTGPGDMQTAAAGITQPRARGDQGRAGRGGRLQRRGALGTAPLWGESMSLRLSTSRYMDRWDTCRETRPGRLRHCAPPLLDGRIS